MSEDEPGKSEDGLDWEELEPEIKGLIKERNPWRGPKVFLVTLVITCLPTFFNVGVNIWSVYNFTNGMTYTKYVSNFSNCHNYSHPSVNNSLCTYGFQVNQYWRFGGCRACAYVKSNVTTQSEDSSNLQFECFERDFIWGFASLVSMFLPGFFGLSQIAEGKGDTFNPVVILSFPFFPLVLLAVKILGLFNPGPNWKIFAQRFGIQEGRLGSQYQLGLQLFIVFIRADRSPSLVQLVTIATSLLMMVKVEIEDELMKQSSLKDGWRRWLRAGIHVPRVLSNGIFISCIFAALATILRNWSLVWILLWPAFNSFSNKVLLPILTSWNQPAEPKLIVKEAEAKEKSILIGMKNKIGFALLLILLTALVITANSSPDLKIPAAWIFYESWIIWKV